MPETRVVIRPEFSTLPRRRRVLRHLLALPLAGLAATLGTANAAGLPEMPAGPGSASARTRLHESAMAHGLAAWRQHHDLNASLSSAWSPASGWQALGPGDADSVQVRLLPAAGLLAVAHGSHAARRSVLRRQVRFGQALAGDAAAWSDETPTDDPLTALSADALGLLLLGPVALLDRATVVNWAEPETLDGRRCDQLVLSAAPGLGLAAESRMALFIDRDAGWLRRLQLAPDARVSGWRGLAELDFFDHFSLDGMVWPRRFHSPSRRWWPGGPAQTGWLTGLDLDRGYAAEALQGEHWSADAAAPARALPPA